MSALTAEAGERSGPGAAHKHKEYLLIGVAGASLLGLFLYMRRTSAANAAAAVTDPSAYTYPSGIGSGADLSGSNPGSGLNELFGQNEEVLRLLAGLSSGAGGASGDPSNPTAGGTSGAPAPSPAPGAGLPVTNPQGTYLDSTGSLFNSAGRPAPLPPTYASGGDPGGSGYSVANGSQWFSGDYLGPAGVPYYTQAQLDAMSAAQRTAAESGSYTLIPSGGSYSSVPAYGTAAPVASTPITSQPAASATLAETSVTTSPISSTSLRRVVSPIAAPTLSGTRTL